MTSASLSYKQQAYVYWDQSQKELAKGDLRQASEKGWGAASQMVKAVAQSLGVDHNGHAALFRVVSGLDNDQFRTAFGLANSLHVNFYEGWLDQASVKHHLDAIGQFIQELDETVLSSAA